MKISHVLGMVGITVLAAISPATAASVPSPSAVTVKVGGSLQTNADAGTSGFAAGVDYVLQPSSTFQPFNVSAYADLLGRGVGAGLAIRNSGPVYAGAGLGLYSVSSVTGLGGKVFGGFNIAPRTTLELGYNFLPQINGTQANTVTLGVGLHL